MISEVNNTFDERRMYFLPFNTAQQEESSQEEDPSRTNGPSSSCHRPQIFKHAWPKDFHVSPFNSRKGSYAITACGPPALSLLNSANVIPSEPFVDIKASLSSSKGRTKMTARLWSYPVPLDPANMSILDSLTFVCSWWWVGLITCKQNSAMISLRLDKSRRNHSLTYSHIQLDPRILVEATKLAFLRNLRIWYRPEVKPTTIARKATPEEM